LNVENLISALSAEITKQKGSVQASGESVAASQGDTVVVDPKERQEVLKGIIRDLHDGKDMEVLKQRFRELVHGVEATEIAKMEQALMNEGLPVEEIKRLCDVHMEIFKEALEEQ